MSNTSIQNRNCTGVTLIEVLVSILILSTGILGVIKMEIIAIKVSQQSTYFSTAMILSTDLSNKMHGNPEQTRDDASNPFLKINFNANKDQIEENVRCFNHVCSPEQLAASDISDWLQRVSTSLPDVRAVVCLDATPWDIVAGKLTWDCHAGTGKSGVVIKLGWSEQNAALDDGSPMIAILSAPHIQ